MPVNYSVYRQLVCVDPVLVGTTRFELATPCTPCKCATGLRYVPKTRRAYAPTVSAGMPKVIENFINSGSPGIFLKLLCTSRPLKANILATNLLQWKISAPI